MRKPGEGDREQSFTARRGTKGRKRGSEGGGFLSVALSSSNPRVHVVALMATTVTLVVNERIPAKIATRRRTRFARPDSEPAAALFL